MSKQRDATESEQWLDNQNLLLSGRYGGTYPACNDAFVPGELDEHVAEKCAVARLAALEEAARYCESTRSIGGPWVTLEGAANGIRALKEKP